MCVCGRECFENNSKYHDEMMRRAMHGLVSVVQCSVAILWQKQKQKPAADGGSSEDGISGRCYEMVRW